MQARDYRIGLLSNTEAPSIRCLDSGRYDFDALVYSCVEGVSKPEPEIYLLALDRLGTAPGEAVFVDDQKDNIEASAELGFIPFFSGTQGSSRRSWPGWEWRPDLRKKALYLLVPLMALTVVMSNCSRPAQEPGPQAALAAYFDALISANYEEAAKYLSAQASRQAEAEPRENESFEAKMVRRTLASYVSYDIDIVERTDAKARATAKIKSPDFNRIAQDIAARLTAAKFPEDGIKSLDYTAEIVNSQIQIYKSRGIPMTSTLRSYILVKEEGAWKISESD